MYYEDIDVEIIDSKDCFGVVSTNSSKTPFSGTNMPDRVLGKSTMNRTPTKRDSTASQFKITKKTKNDFEERERAADYPKMSIESTDFKCQPASTFQEKLSVLEERDKYLRDTIYRDVSKNMNVITTGTCPDMCPEKERLLREIHCSFSLFEGEIVENEIHVVPELLVKEYSRSSADQDEPLPHELRPEPVLVDTMSHILINILPKIEEPSVDVGEWYNFCWDRLRSLRKDIIQQQICSKNIVTLLEQSARFHICCFDRLFDYDRRIFDDKINAENLVNCLQMLMNMYEDLESCGQLCGNESEFRVYMMLLLLDSGDVPDVLRWHDQKGRKIVEEAKQIFFAFKLKLYTKFFKLVKKTSYLNACILQRYFAQTRSQTLNVLVNAYSSGSHKAKFPVSFLREILELDSDEDTVSFVENFSLKMNYETGEVSASKSSFTLPEVKPACKSSYILKNKRKPILEAVTTVHNYTNSPRESKVHSSFNENDVLNENAFLAGDQREKIIHLYGDIYEERSENVESEQEVEGMIEDEMGVVACGKDSSKVPTAIMSTPTSVMSTFNFGVFSKMVEVKPNSPLEKIEFPKQEFKSPVTFSFSSVQSLMKPPAKRIESPLGLSTPVKSPSLLSNEPSALDEPAENIVQNNFQEEKTLSPRKCEDVMQDLTNALSQFEQIYWAHFGITKEDRISYRREQTLKMNRKLRRIVKRRLKHKNAKKIARIWRKKIEIRKKKGENFIGLVHLSPEEYFRLWGTRRKNTANIVEEFTDAKETVSWGRKVLTSESITIKYIGVKLARLVFTALCTNLSIIKLPPVICFRLLVSVPNKNDSVCLSFVAKIREFCRLLFYADEKRDLGSVQATIVNGVPVLTSVDVNSPDLVGVSHLVIYVNDHWETVDECLDRISNMCNELVYPVHVSVIITGEMYKENLVELMNILQKEQIIAEWSVTRWCNFFTLPKTIMKNCQRVLKIPHFCVSNLKSFMENMGNDLFANFYYLCDSTINNSPVTFINIYNEFLTKLKEAISNENARKYNLSEVFLSAIKKNDTSEDNLRNIHVPDIINKYSLIGFTKWPPKSTMKMIEVLSKYCSVLDAENTLFPNVLRLVNPVENVSLQCINKEAPWLKIVELWFKYNVNVVSKNENAEDIYIFYEEKKIENVVKGFCIAHCKIDQV